MDDSIAKGSLEIQDGVYQNQDFGQEVRRGLARQDLVDSVIPQKPVFLRSDNSKSFNVKVSCTKFASFYDEGVISQTKMSIQKETSYRRIAGKNYLKDIKEFLCPIAGYKEASLVRKRLIGLQKIHSTISNQLYNFSID